MKTEGKFPRNLIDAEIKERIEYFDKLTLRHPLFDASSKELLDAVLCDEEEPLILVAGPSRVGKTTLVKWLKKQMGTLWESLCTPESGRMPFVSVEAVACGYNNFRWKDYYIRCLIEMKEPLIDKKVLYKEEKGLAVYGSRGSTPALRRSMEKTLEYRKPLVFIIDEAQHLTRVSKGRLEEQMDCIKSLANMTG